MTALSHLPWPYRLGQTVQQDTPQEHSASVAVILNTPRGQRPDEPTFGVTLPLFEAVPVDAASLAGQVAESDTRLDDLTIEDLTQLVDVTAARLHIDLTGE